VDMIRAERRNELRQIKDKQELTKDGETDRLVVGDSD
jgi:hypothetical protein